MKVTIKGWVHHEKRNWMDKAEYVFWHRKLDTDPALIPIFEHAFDVEIPDDFDPTPAKITILRAEKRRIQAEANVKANNIEAQIQELLCIEDCDHQ